MSQYLSKDWNVSISHNTDVFKVYDQMFSKVSRIYTSTAKLILENAKIPVNLFSKIIINDEYEIEIIKKEDMLSLYYPHMNESIPLTDKYHVEISLFNLPIEALMKIEFVTFNKIKNISYIFCPFFSSREDSTFKSSFLILDQKNPQLIMNEKLPVKIKLISNNKVKEIKSLKDFSQIVMNEKDNNKFTMISVIHNKTKYTEHHLIKSLNNVNMLNSVL